MKRKIFDLIREIWKIPILEKVLVKLTKGVYFGNLITKFPPNHYKYPKSSIRFAKRDNIKYRLDISDLVDWYVYFGFKEVSRQRLYELVCKGNCVIDVGTNIGDVAMHCAKIVGSKGEVHAFEPHPVNYKRLKENLDLNNFSNIVTNNAGLGKEESVLSMINVDEHNKGMNRIVDGENQDNTIQVEIKTLDRYVEENNLFVDFVKIDVEGFELKVLKGSRNVIKAFHPTLFVELDDNNLIEQGNSAKELVVFLEDLDYQLFSAETKDRISRNDNFEGCHYDVIAIYNQ